MKFNVKKLVIVLISVIVVSFSAASLTLYFTGGISALSVRSSQIKTSESYPSEGIEKLIVKTADTKINLVSVVDKKIGIDFYGSVTTNLNEVKPQLKSSLEDGVLTVEILYPRTLNIGLINFEQLYLDIYVPQNYRGYISAESGSADLDVRRLTLSGFDFKTVSGNFNAEALSAKIINIETVSGKSDLKDISGQISINTVSGEVNAFIDSLQGSMKVKSISGKVNIELPEESEFEFEFDSISGNIKNEFPADIKFVNNRKIEGSVGRGAHSIIISTTSGDISIEKGE